MNPTVRSTRVSAKLLGIGNFQGTLYFKGLDVH